MRHLPTVGDPNADLEHTILSVIAFQEKFCRYYKTCRYHFHGCHCHLDSNTTMFKLMIAMMIKNMLLV